MGENTSALTKRTLTMSKEGVNRFITRFFDRGNTPKLEIKF